MSNSSSGGFFSNLFSSLFGKSDAEADKKRQLKNIAKSLSKSKYNKFYKYGGNEALPSIAKFFYEIYKAIYPAQSMFHQIQNKEILKKLVIDYSTPDNIKEIEESLSEEKIIQMSRQIPLENLKDQVPKRVSEYADYFNLEKITEVDNLYKQLMGFRDFCAFDYYFFIKKFNKTLKEGSFLNALAFEKINAEYILDDLKDFMAIAWALPLDADWTNLFKLLKAYKGKEPVQLVVWKKILTRLGSIKSSRTFEMMIKLISANPAITVEPNNLSSNIIEPHLDQLKHQTEETVNKLVQKATSEKTNDISKQLFGESEVMMLPNYNESLNSIFERKGILTFNNCAALSYLKNFLIEVVKKDIREYYDLVIVRGQWESQSLCAPFSDGYNSLLMISDKITVFDKELAEDGPIGIKIKTLLPKTERDNGAKNIISRLVNDANTDAYTYIVESTRNLITMGKIIKSLVDDIAKQKPQIISNWNELSRYSDIPMSEFNVSLYKKIYLFTSLIKTCLVQQEITHEQE
ncbi:MAG: DUF5312 family protein [Treponema sp.]|nr:DUF5312 family protein [Treponema sp.]